MVTELRMAVFLLACAATKLGSTLTAGKSTITQHQVTYFEMSKASVAAGLYRVAKCCRYSISGCALQNRFGDI